MLGGGGETCDVGGSVMSARQAVWREGGATWLKLHYPATTLLLQNLLNLLSPTAWCIRTPGPTDFSKIYSIAAKTAVLASQRPSDKCAPSPIAEFRRMYTSTAQGIHVVRKNI